MPVLDKIQKPFSGQNSKAVLWTKFKVLSPGQNSKAVLWTKFKVRSPILQNLQNRARNGVQNRSFPIVNVLKSTKNRPKNFNPLSYPIGGGIGGPFVSIKIRFSKNDFLILPTFPIVNVLKWVFLVPMSGVCRRQLSAYSYPLQPTCVCLLFSNKVALPISM